MLNPKNLVVTALSGVTAIALACASGCGSSSNSASEDNSSSGSVAAAAGGAYNGSSANGTQSRLESRPGATDQLLAMLEPQAVASTACPTFNSTTLTSCLSSTQTLTYSGCSFGSSTATWSGSVGFTCTGSVSSPTVVRAVANGTTRTNSYGTVVTFKSSGTTIFTAGTAPSGGTTFTPSSLTINGVELTGSNGGTTTFDHVITSSALTVSNSAVNGTVTVYHNLAKVIGTSTVALSFSSGCCTPTGGSVTTVFHAATGFGARSGFDGVTESLTFTGCGTANYQGPEGTSKAVTVANCI